MIYKLIVRNNYGESGTR